MYACVHACMHVYVVSNLVLLSLFLCVLSYITSFCFPGSRFCSFNIIIYNHGNDNCYNKLSSLFYFRCA